MKPPRAGAPQEPESRREPQSAPLTPARSSGTTPAMHALRAAAEPQPDAAEVSLDGPAADPRRAAFAAELGVLAPEARQRRSVDSFARAALFGFAWAILGGVLGKLLWDSARPPLFFWPLAVLDLLLLWEAAGSYLRGRLELRRELAVEDRVRTLRVALGIDEVHYPGGVLPALRAEPPPGEP